MAGQQSAIFGWGWTEVSVLGSQVFGQASMGAVMPYQEFSMVFWVFAKFGRWFRFVSFFSFFFYFL